VAVAADPAWCALNSDEYDAAPVPAAPNGASEGTTAYRKGNAAVLDANEISQPAPRLVDAVVDLVRALHPDIYDAEIEGALDAYEGGTATPSPTSSETATATPTPSSTPTPETTPTPTPTSGDAPGFGPLVAAVALLLAAAAGVGRRSP
jgi:iron complex transport system substrate-binding protein